jgi:hypothetical protein
MISDSDTRNGEWPERPWLMAAAGAAGGLLLYLLTDGLRFEGPPDRLTLTRMAGATAVAVATLSFLITAERRRLAWAAAFALAWGAVMGLIGYFTASYNNNGELAGFPFLSGLFAVAVAGPLFQTVRDEGRWSLPYPKLHRYAWTDAIIGGASLAFTGLTFLLSFLLASLFDAIGISVFKNLLEEGWFALMLAGAAFGAASAVLRERDSLLGTLQRLVMAVFSVLAPVLAGALALYLLAMPATGFAGLWRSGLPETPLLLSTAAFAVVFLNAIIGDSSEDRGKGLLWRLTEGVLLLGVLPLALLALVSMGMRVGQYGWTPERLWGVVAALVAIGYGLAAWLAAGRGRREFDGPLRDYQKKLAVGLTGLALLLALPVVDFGAISTRSQLARLESGKVAPEKFDWAALAFDFGPAGRRALTRAASAGPTEQRRLAARALSSKDRWEIAHETRVAQEATTIDRHVRIVGPGVRLDDRLRRAIAAQANCGEGNPCLLYPIGGERFAVVTTAGTPSRAAVTIVDSTLSSARPKPDDEGPEERSLEDARLEVRAVSRRQLFVDGKPVGEPFE